MSKRGPLAVCLHLPTRKYYVVGDEGLTVIGPFERHEILRNWRVASQPNERVLGIPNYHEAYRPVPPPFPPEQARPVRPCDLPPSVTVHRFPDTAPDIEWFSPEAQAREDLIALANTGGTWIGIDDAVFGRVARGTVLWGHPADAVLICHRPLPGERVAVVELAPR